MSAAIIRFPTFRRLDVRIEREAGDLGGWFVLSPTAATPGCTAVSTMRLTMPASSPAATAWLCSRALGGSRHDAADSF